jgi:predicted amidophosphoribosyltransferase
MSLIACPDCGGAVSTSAAVCPHCGCSLLDFLGRCPLDRSQNEAAAWRRVHAATPAAASAPVAASATTSAAPAPASLLSRLRRFLGGGAAEVARDREAE